MILTGFDLYQYRLPLVATLKLGGVEHVEREGFLVRLTSSTGAVGWGDVAPLPGFSRESLPEARRHLSTLRETLRGWAITPDWVEPEGAFVHHLDSQNLAPSVRFGVELALWSLVAASRHTTLAQLLAPHPRATVSVNGLLLGTAQEVLENARRLREAGYRAAKLKVGREAVEEEVVLVRSVSRVLGPGVRLRLDANRAWDFGEAAAFVRGTTGLAIEYLEEPLKDPARLADLAAQYEVPVALDETLLDLSAETLGRHAYARAVILKPTFLGGLIPTLRLARRALALGMTPVLSAAFESGIGVRGLAALAASLGPDDVPAGLDTYRWLADDVLAPRLDLGRGRLGVEALMDASYRINEPIVSGIY